MNEFETYLKKIKEYGIVEEINHPVVICSGIPGASLKEVVIFEDGQIGEVIGLENDRAEILSFSKNPVKPGIKITRTEQRLSVPVGDELLGKIIDPLGNLVYDGEPFEITGRREIDIKPLGMTRRARIRTRLHTGVSLIDLLLPLGKGQRELILGDRKTGKTWTLLTIIKNQVNEGDVIVYTLVGKERTECKRLSELFLKEDVLKNTVMVATSSDDSSGLIDIAPYSAMSIAEYFRDQGKDVLLILDDMSTHAKFYREISLISKKFPGRDSYPGDVFYKHARLLERAGNFLITEDKSKEIKSEAAITCLGVAETVESRLTDYIISNLIGITDGHLLFDTEIFNKGRRPAIDIFLSVTRVGKQTQDSLTRQLAAEILQVLSLYNNAQEYSHLGTELSETVQRNLTIGEQLYSFFEQTYDIIVPHEVQLVMLTMISQGYLVDFTNSDIRAMRDNVISNYILDLELKSRIDIIVSVKKFSDLKENVLQNISYLKENASAKRG